MWSRKLCVSIRVYMPPSTMWSGPLRAGMTKMVTVRGSASCHCGYVHIEIRRAVQAAAAAVSAESGRSHMLFSLHRDLSCSLDLVFLRGM